MVDKTMNEDKPLSIDEVPAEMRVIGETEDGRRIAVDADIPMKLHISLEEDATVFVEMPDPMEEEDAEDGWPEEEDGPFDPDALDLEDCEECSIKDECDAYAEEFEEQSENDPYPTDFVEEQAETIRQLVNEAVRKDEDIEMLHKVLGDERDTSRRAYQQNRDLMERLADLRLALQTIANVTDV